MGLAIFDEEGFLLDAKTWTEDLAQKIAASHGLKLTCDHWKVVRAVQEFYNDTGVSPSLRPLVKLVRDRVDPALGSSLALMSLFSERTTRRVAQISGLPKPSDCL